MPFVLHKQTRFARVYKDKGTNRGFMKATVAPMNYESVLGNGDYNTPIDLKNVTTDNADIDGYVMDSAAYYSQIQVDVETGAQPDQGSMMYTFNGHSFPFKFTELAYLHVPTGDMTEFGGGLDYTVTPPVLLESTRNLGSHADVPDEVVTCISRIDWDDLQLQGGETPVLRFSSHAEKIRINIRILKAHRNWTESNDPNLTADADTLAGPLYEVDWSDIPRVYLADGTLVDPLVDDFNDDSGGIYFRDLNDDLIAYLPKLGSTYNAGNPFENQNTITSFWTDGGTSYMHKGKLVDEYYNATSIYGFLSYFLVHDGDYKGNDWAGSVSPTYGYFSSSFKGFVGYAGDTPPAYKNYIGFRFEAPVPRGASLTNGGASEYAELQMYSSTFEYSYPEVIVDAWADVQVPNGERFVDTPAYVYDPALLSNTAFPSSPNWVDTAVSTTTTLAATPGNVADPHTPVDVAAPMEERLTSSQWVEENGLRLRLDTNSLSVDGNITGIAGYAASEGISTSLNVMFTYPGAGDKISRHVKRMRKAQEMKKFNKRMKLEREDAEATSLIKRFLKL